MDNRINLTSIAFTHERTAAKTDFGALLARGVSAGVGVASAMIPGGAVLSAAVNRTLGQAAALEPAVRGGASAQQVGGVGATAPGVASSGSSADGLEAQRELMVQNQRWTAQYLSLQNEMQRESREYNTVSNILKVRHESAKTAINNIR